MIRQKRQDPKGGNGEDRLGQLQISSDGSVLLIGQQACHKGLTGEYRGGDGGKVQIPADDN